MISLKIVEPSDALKKYIVAKMELSKKRPFASKVFAMEIISGAPSYRRLFGY